MDRRDFLKLAGAGLCLPALGGSTVARAAGGSLPNIVLVMADDQGWGDMAYNGHPVLKTPNFDEMAATGLRFDRFYAAHPVCSPTRGSVMTGRNPNRFGCFSWGNTLRPQEVTIAEALRTAGYITGHFGKWHLGAARKGSPVNPGASGFDEWFSAPNFYDNDPILSREGVAVQTEGESSIVTAEAALEFIRRHSGGDRPFLAVVWFGSPHGPHEAVDEDRRHYLDQPEELQHFYGEITGMDRAFGKLRSELGKLGIRNNTILWYCSDNGGLPRIGSTGGRGYKGQIYEGGLRVPAILEWPERLTGHRVTNIPCYTADLYPTLLEIAGVRIDNQPPLDGISLTALLAGEMQSRPEPIGFWFFPEGGVPTPAKAWLAELLEDQRRGDMLGDLAKLRLESVVISKQYPEDMFPGHAAWLDWPWKLHRIQDRQGMVRYELYNLEDDPGEESDLAPGRQQRVAAMGESLQQWQVSVLRSLNGKDY
ncbi:MAG: sulfatase-like hydrolase/transferase [Candidatus Glassbacteria bacterium]|nr:sulfatase-like hydrolase/transferase [Candidatus Glassbacteria bacterium]